MDTTITVRVGKEEKEISGLTRKTTCSDVLQALLKEKLDENIKRENNNCEKDSKLSTRKHLKKLAQSYLIVESWRGCEKILPGRTRILAVWQAWDKEQCYVKFSLVKNKPMEDTRAVEMDESPCRMNNENVNPIPVSESAHFLQKLSHDQKRRIRRKFMHYQRAVLSQQTNESNTKKEPVPSPDIEPCAAPSAGDRISLSRHRSPDSTKVTFTLSEEQFVDGVVTGPDCLLQKSSKFIQSALDNRDKEYCTYRRRNHRRRSLMTDDSDALSDQNVILSHPKNTKNVHHYPYCKKSRRSRSTSSRKRSHKRKSRMSKSGHRRGRRGHVYSTDDTATTNSTTTSTTSTASEPDGHSHSEGEDADDEKSIMAEFGSIVSRQKLPPYPEVTREPYITTSETAPATDSCSGTTTCSETSNTSGSSFSGTTSSSEISSGTDYLSEALLVQKAAEAKALALEKAKSSKAAAKLFRKVTGPSLAKPSSGILGSFKKKKKVPAVPKISAGKKSTGSKRTVTFAANGNKGAREGITHDKGVPQNKVNHVTPSDKEQTAADKADDSKSIEELKKLILSQGETLNSQSVKLCSADETIQKIESEIHKSRSRTHGKNYVQDTYLTGLGSKDLSSPASPLHPPHWIQECPDANILQEYAETCEKIVQMQMKIEEQKRESELVLLKMQDEVWRASNDPNYSGEPTSPLTAAASALGLVNNHDSSDDECRLESLSVTSSGKKKKRRAPDIPKREKVANAESTIELEKSRTELEANLYISLRLTSEIEETDQQIFTSQRAVQSKGEQLLSLVRQLAQSAEGISADLWEEYGPLLTAYDSEVLVQRYLNNSAEYNSPFRPESVKNMNEDPQSPTTDALHHALSPWLWCEHCKLELMQQQQGKALGTPTPPLSPHWLSHTSVPSNFSELPLPSPQIIPNSPSKSITELLPMPPIPDQDSDCDSDNRDNATSTIISTETAVPRGMVLRHSSKRQKETVQSQLPLKDYLAVARNNSATNTDDSGNASAGSTASFGSNNSDGASTDMGSRNSSCDGGSPRPPSFTGTESQDSGSSSPYFSWKRFVFPNQYKDEISKSLAKNAARSQSAKPGQKGRLEPLKPPVPPKPGCFASAPSSPADTNRTYYRGDHVVLQQQKLIRRNSGGRRRSPALPGPDSKPTDDAFGKRASSFGRAGVHPGSIPTHLSGLLTKPIIHNSHCDISQKPRATTPTINDNSKLMKRVGKVPKPIKFIPPNGIKSAPCSPYQQGPRRLNIHPVISDVKRKTNETVMSYDDDSDTGLSSLHSADSDMFYSETLV